jgi:hypothetical protein
MEKYGDELNIFCEKTSAGKIKYMDVSKLVESIGQYICVIDKLPATTGPSSNGSKSPVSGRCKVFVPVGVHAGKIAVDQYIYTMGRVSFYP